MSEKYFRINEVSYFPAFLHPVINLDMISAMWTKLLTIENLLTIMHLVAQLSKNIISLKAIPTFSNQVCLLRS